MQTFSFTEMKIFFKRHRQVLFLDMRLARLKAVRVKGVRRGARGNKSLRLWEQTTEQLIGYHYTSKATEKYASILTTCVVNKIKEQNNRQ